MGAIISVLFTLVSAPFVIGITYKQRHITALLHLKSFKVLIISFILWLLLLSQAGLSTGPDATRDAWKKWPPYISSIIFLISGTLLMIGKRV